MVRGNPKDSMKKKKKGLLELRRKFIKVAG